MHTKTIPIVVCAPLFGVFLLLLLCGSYKQLRTPPNTYDPQRIFALCAKGMMAATLVFGLTVSGLYIHFVETAAYTTHFLVPLAVVATAALHISASTTIVVFTWRVNLFSENSQFDFKYREAAMRLLFSSLCILDIAAVTIAIVWATTKIDDDILISIGTVLFSIHCLVNALLMATVLSKLASITALQRTFVFVLLAAYSSCPIPLWTATKEDLANGDIVLLQIISLVLGCPAFTNLGHLFVATLEHGGFRCIPLIRTVDEVCNRNATENNK